MCSLLIKTLLIWYILIHLNATEALSDNLMSSLSIFFQVCPFNCQEQLWSMHVRCPGSANFLLYNYTDWLYVNDMTRDRFLYSLFDATLHERGGIDIHVYQVYWIEIMLIRIFFVLFHITRLSLQHDLTNIYYLYNTYSAFWFCFCISNHSLVFLSSFHSQITTVVHSFNVKNQQNLLS